MKFELTENEAKEAETFFKEHKKCRVSHQTTTGGGCYYKFMPTGLESIIIVSCGFCKEEKDITDISNW